jgi:hypothetical protein
MSNAIRFADRESFIAALEERRPFWRAYDKRRAAEHKAQEREYLAEARAKLREALKLDYATLKERHGYSVPIGSAPSCPVLMEAKIDTVLASLKLTQSKSFTVDSHGGWETAHKLLTWDPDAVTTVC